MLTATGGLCECPTGQLVEAQLKATSVTARSSLSAAASWAWLHREGYSAAPASAKIADRRAEKRISVPEVAGEAHDSGIEREHEQDPLQSRQLTQAASRPASWRRVRYAYLHLPAMPNVERVRTSIRLQRLPQCPLRRAQAWPAPELEMLTSPPPPALAPFPSMNFLIVSLNLPIEPGCTYIMWPAS